jgi:cation transport regulator ChaB
MNTITLPIGTARIYTDLINAAIDYVDAPDDSDDAEKAYLAMVAAVEKVREFEDDDECADAAAGK